MDAVTFIFNAENLRTLFLFVAGAVGFALLDKRIDKKMNALGETLRREMGERFTAFHKQLKEVDFPQLTESIMVLVRAEMDERFAAFHKQLKEVDFPQLTESIMVLVRAEMDERFAAFHKQLKEVDFPQLIASFRIEMDERITAFHKALKENDIAHLERTIKALTYSLEKNGFLKPEDKSFIDSHLSGG